MFNGISVVQLTPSVLLGIAILMLFLAGFAYGKCVERRAWLMGIAMVVLGGVLVGLTIALGG